jgi:hypothetical protein
MSLLETLRGCGRVLRWKSLVSASIRVIIVCLLLNWQVVDEPLNFCSG